MSAVPLLSVKGLSCGYNHQMAVAELSFDIAETELCCLLGPSGCGKSTLLRAIAGFVSPLSGHIELRGRQIASPTRQMPPEKRRIGLVFQDYALFPHMTAADNIGFTLHRETAGKRRHFVSELLELVQLSAADGDRFPHELSGGEQQRIALARGLAQNPALLLLDEPFSNLDSHLRTTLNRALKDWLQKRSIAALLVTHDQEEGFAFADRMGVLYAGRRQQWDTPYNLYHRPANRFTASFVGQGSFLSGQLDSNRAIVTALGSFPAPADLRAAAGEFVDVLIPTRRYHLCGKETNADPLSHRTTGFFRRSDFVHSATDGRHLASPSLMPSHRDLAVGEEIGIRTDLKHLITFPKTADAGH